MPEPLLRRVAPAWFLFFLAPVTAEYLIGYDDTIGDPAALIFGLFIFGPLYGAPAVLIRETTRRAGRGWPSMLMLGVAFGLFQAGLVDQSLFNPDYRDISYWVATRQPTLIPALGISASMTLGFVGGHLVGSICAPIALAESMVPERSTKPWLGRLGLFTMALLWAAGAGFVLADTLSSESFRPSPAQLTVTSLLVVGLVVVAFTRPRVASRRAAAGPVPSPLVVLVVATLCLGVRPLLDSISARDADASYWVPTLVGLGVLATFGLLVLRWSRRSGWGSRHVLAVAAGGLLSIGIVAFTVTPIGHVPPAAKYTTNSVLFVLIVVLLTVATGRQRGAAALE